MGGKGSPPPAPDYVGAAQLQGELSREALTAQNYANRPTQTTPFGSTTWGTRTVRDPSTGQDVTAWEQTTSLTPELQAALNAQVGSQKERSQLASDFMGRVEQDYSRPFDWQNLPQMAQLTGASQLGTRLSDYTPGLQTGLGAGAPALPQFSEGYRDTVARTLMERMQPVHERQQQQLETQLANQGFTVGSEGYKRAMDELQQRQAGERYNALDTAGAEAQRLFTMGMGSRQQAMAETQFANQALGQASALDLQRMQAINQALASQQGLNQQYADYQNRLRQQAIAEQMQRRGMSLNELNALLSGQQVQMPQMPSFVASGRAETPNILQATGMGYDAALGAYNAQQAAGSNLMGGLFGLGAAALGNPYGLFGFGR